MHEDKRTIVPCPQNTCELAVRGVFGSAQLLDRADRVDLTISNSAPDAKTA